MRELRFYNTLTRKKELFTPIDATRVRLYVCGPTVYDYAHIGNARPVIVFDMLFRLLRHIYGKDHVIYARNITDVDDKINTRAAYEYPELALNEAIRRLTERTYFQFQQDTRALGCLLPTSQPRATDHLEEMRSLIERLLEKGHAYIAENHILFSVSSIKKHPSYGSFAKRSLEEMRAGARVDVAAYKKEEMDFVLWKPSMEGEPGWTSPAGISVLGRPGWHIECSAMSMAKLLEPYGGGLSCDDPTANIFDIHGGGIDLIFPHHENEIAQSCSAFGTERMANLWMHNGFVQVEGKKMSKSLGNFITIRSVLENNFFDHNDILTNEMKQNWAGLSARFSMLQTHYREPLNWTAQRLTHSSNELYRWYELLRSENAYADKNEALDASLINALSDDLNTPNAFALLRQFYKRGDAVTLANGMSLFGLLRPEWVRDVECPLFMKKTSLDEKFIDQRIAERLQLIHNKEWAAADTIRDALAAEGVILKDSKDPQTGERITVWDIKRL
ncbi:cysteinyl-tRNA synthetase [Bartonella vinsonii subsp. arupensis Pm136co]|uniref:Cysteine--tRNA ligase n=1 Tax=Bartonella vinsonii subsp. arupensis Pm136co TaxID=1094561 RepID=A0ABN0GR24_BARVI|nr:cysteine--tRNA ligase [Bartonella vinsonii]EJF98741.1 cysteinyl-tRNA synthetase [Bartonella vinsonii subsp. arupensis Pm136co]